MESITLEDHLEETCSHKKEYEPILVCWKAAKIKYERILDNVKTSYSTYSKHDISHVNSVVSNIESILGNDAIISLSLTDTWMILESSYIHDLGMVIDSDEIKRDWGSKEFRVYRQGLLNSDDKDLKEAALCISSIEETAGIKPESWPLETSNAVKLIVSGFYRSRHAERSKQYYLECGFMKSRGI